MTDKLDIIIDKLNRIEAHAADTKADTAALKSAIIKALELLDAAKPEQLELPIENMLANQNRLISELTRWYAGKQNGRLTDAK